MSAGRASATHSKFSQKVLNSLAKVIPEIVGGSADLTGSNYTNLDCSFDFQKARPVCSHVPPLVEVDLTVAWGCCVMDPIKNTQDTPAGRYLRFGVREHGTLTSPRRVLSQEMAS